ncbi:hypothetical protein [uncultured Paracoccus sp.]|uniref:hypothetical protein n=1 Tax=uncultured Paracoccus sp. TaxID=189685 RepID=UPI00260288EB|nr:hypothetical protein [uncultured Paracoccus sp.]
MSTLDQDQPVTLHCRYCGGQNLLADACARWNVETQQWEMSHVYDGVTCEDCETETRADERPIEGGA